MISEETLAALEFDRVRLLAASLAASSLGSERIMAMRPFESAAEAEECMMLSGEMVRLLASGDFPIHGAGDIRQELRLASVAGATLDSEQLLRIASTSEASQKVRRFLQAQKTRAPLLLERAKAIGDLDQLVEAIQRAIAPDGLVRDEASSALRRIRQSLRSEARVLEDRLQGILHRWADKGWLQENVISYRDGKLVLPVKDELRHHVQGVVVDQSASGATVFVEPVETLEISNRLRQLELEEKREIHRILQELTAAVHARLDDLWRTLEILSELDEFYARGRLALRWEGVDVALNDRGLVRILRGRHPLLLERLKERVVALNIEIAPPLRTVVISGPNAGGKTVVLKTVGLLSVMAAAGLLLPVAPGSELPFFRGIHADIGDAQSIESDLSTFTAHLARLKRMIEDSSAPKLVLVDEIGSSTDPAVGAALAQAVLLELTAQQAVSLVTTHHGALKAFAHETAGIANGSMAFDEASLVPTYVYRSGLPGSSYALEIAQRVGFPGELLAAARQFLGAGMIGLEKLVSDLSQKIEQYEKLRRESDLKLTEYAALQKLYAERTQELKKVQAEAKAKALKEADALLDRAGRDVEATIRRLKEEQASRESMKKAREKIQEMRKQVEQAREDVSRTLEPERAPRVYLKDVRLGDVVQLENFSGTGKVVSLQKGGKRAEVEIGGVRMWVDATRLLAAPEDSSRPAPRVKVDFNLETRHVSDRIDLRGKYGDEALPELDSFLAAAAEANLKQITVIHGKGTGALRAKVLDFLNTHPLVKSFHDGGRHQDDFGSTVVELN